MDIFNNKVFFLGAYFSMLLIGLFYFSYVYKRRHWRWCAAENILKNINRIEGINYKAKKFGFIRKVDPFVFESVILRSLDNRGIVIKRNKRVVADGGIDGRFKLEGFRWKLIQVKRYSSVINPKHVKDFAELCKKKKTKGIFVHTGRTGPKSYSNLTDNIEIISGNRLLRLLNGQPLSVFSIDI